jgi:adenylate kinase family enzyme
MKRVLVIGSSGAGKSTFARRLQQATGLKLIHLDRVFWKPDWVEPSKSEWRKTVEEIVKEDEWIMDGNYSGTLEVRLPHADTVIFLDFPRTICIYRILKRVVFYKKGSRPDIPEGCDERFDWTFLKLVWNYPNRSKPKVEELLKQIGGEKKVIRLRSTKEVENFFVDL